MFSRSTEIPHKTQWFTNQSYMFLLLPIRIQLQNVPAHQNPVFIPLIMIARQEGSRVLVTNHA